MTQEEFERLNPIICTTYGIMGCNMYDAMVMQGEFLAARTFILDTLNEDESQFVRLRYGVGTKTPTRLNDIEKILNIPIKNIKEMDLRVLRKLRHPYRIKLLKLYTDNTIDKSILDRYNKLLITR